MTLPVPRPRTPRPRTPRQKTLLDILVLVGLSLLFFWRDIPLVGADYRGFAQGDFGWQFYAFAAYKAARLHAGQLPLWGPYALAGHPFLADIQSAVFYPLGLFTVALTAFTGFSYAALQLEAIIHIPLTAVGMYLLAVRLTGSRAGGRVAAVAFAFSSYLTGYPLLQLAILETVAWFPWLLLALDHAVPHVVRGEWRAARPALVAAGALFGIALLAGHPQSAMLVFYGSAAYTVFRYLQLARQLTRRAAGRLVGIIGAYGLIGAALAAAQLLPGLEYMRLSTRAGLNIETAGQGFTPYALLELILPQVSSPFAALYIGVAALGLAVWALAAGALLRKPEFAKPEWELARFFGVGAVVGLLLSFGKLTPVYQLAYLLAPGWRLFRQQERLAVWIVFCLAMLAGLGAAALSRSWVRERAAGAVGRFVGFGLARGFWIAAGLALVFSAACLIGYLGGVEGLWGFTAAGLWLSGSLALAGLAIWRRSPALLVVVLLLDLFTLAGGQHAGDAASARPFPPGSLAGQIQPTAAPFRVANDDILPGNFGYGYGLEATSGDGPLRLAAYDFLLENAPKPTLWRLFNVQYVISWRGELDAPAERLAEQPARDDKPAYLFRLAETTPRAWLVGDVVVEEDAAARQRLVLDPAFAPRRRAVVDRLPQPAAVPDCTGNVEWLARDPEFLRLRVTNAAACLLVLGEVDYPGWQATVDGQPAEILRANTVLRSVALPPGAHEVQFAFRPLTVTVGLALSALTLLAIVLVLLALPQKIRRIRA